MSALACGIDERPLDGGAGCPGAAGCASTAAGASGSGGAPLAEGGSGGAAAGGTAGDAGAAGSGPAGGTSAAAAGAAGTAAGGSSAGVGGAAGSAGAGSVASSCSTGQLLVNGGFEAGPQSWVSFSTGTDPLIYDTSVDGYEGVAPHGGQYLGWLGGTPNETNRLSQSVTLPPGVTRLTFVGALRVQVFETHDIIDFLRGSLTVSGQSIAWFALDNGDATDDWVDFAMPLDVAAYAGQSVTLDLESQIGDGPGTNFFLDDVALIPECAQ